MSFGLGGGANLGSATGYLFIDPSGVARGLTRAGNDLRRFEQASQRVGEQAARSAAASASATAGAVLGDPATVRRLQQLNTDIGRQIGDTTRVIQDSYKKRKAALDSFITSSAAERRAIAQSKIAQVQAIQDITNQQQKLIKATDRLNQAQARGVSGRSLGTFRGNVTFASNQLARFQAASQALANDVISANSRIARSHTATKDIITQAFREEQAALDSLRASLRNQTAERQRLAQIGGADLTKQAQASEAVAQRITRNAQLQISNLQALQKVQDRIAAAGPSTNLAPLVAREEQLVRRRQALTDIMANDFVKLSNADRAFTTAMTAESARRIGVAEREAAALTAARAEQQAALSGVRRQLAADVLNASTKAAIGLGVAIAGTTAVFVGFEQAMINVQAITGETDASMEKFSSRVQEMSVELARSPTDLAKGLYVIAQAGFDAAESMEILEIAAIAATAGLTDVETAATPIIAVLSSGMKNLEGELLTAADASDILFASVTDGIFSFEELAQQTGDNIPLAAQLGISLEELAASYVILTRAGNKLSESTTQINGIMRAFLKPTEALAAVLEEAGYQSGSFAIEELGLAGAMKLAHDAANGNNDALADMFPLIRGLRGEVALSVDDFQALITSTEDMAASMEGGGRTMEVFAIQTKSTAFQLKQAGEEIRNAAITFGADFAPAVLQVAKAIGDLAQSFAGLSPEMRGVITELTTFGFAASLAVLGLGKIIQMGVAVVGVFTRMGIVLTALGARLGLVGGALTLLKFSPIILALTGLAAITYKVISAHNDHKRAVQELKQSYSELWDVVQSLQLQGMAEEASAVAKVYREIGNAAEVAGRKVAEEQRKLADLQNQMQQQVPPTGNERARLLSQIRIIEDNIKAYGDLIEVQDQAIDLAKAILSEPGIDYDRATADILKHTAAWKAENDTSEEYIANLLEMADNAGAYALAADDATQATEEVGDAAGVAADKFQTLGEFFRRAVSPTEDFRSAVADLIAEVQAANNVIGDLSEPLSVIQELMGRKITGGTVFDALRELDAAGLLNFTSAMREAIEVADQLADVEADIERLGEAITNNADDISMWEGRIQLVDDTIGLVEDGYDLLNELVTEGRLTQEQANAVLEDAIWLRERSVGGVLDERAEQALLISDLRDYVELHDDVHGTYEQLTSDQKGRIAALQDETTQMTLFTAVLLSMLEAMNLVPKGVTAQFLADMSKWNPVVGALFDDIGILDGTTVTVDMEANDEGLRAGIASITEDLQQLRRLRADLQIRLENGEDVQQEIDDINDAIGRLTRARNLLKLELFTDADTEDMKEIDSLIDSISRKDKEFTIIVDDQEAAIRLRELLGIEFPDKEFNIVIKGDDPETLNRRLRRLLEKNGFETQTGGNVQSEWRVHLDLIGAEDTERRIAFINSIMQGLTGDEGEVEIKVNDARALLAIQGIVEAVDLSLLTPEFIMFLDANNDGALDATEIAKLEAEGFERTYEAFLKSNAEEVLPTLNEVKGVQVEIQDNGTILVTADTQEALDNFKALNDEKLNDKTINVRTVVTPIQEGDLTGGPDPTGAGDFEVTPTVTSTEVIQIKTEGAEEAKGDIDEVKQAADDLPDSEDVKVTVTIVGKDVLDEVTKTIEEMKDKTITISVATAAAGAGEGGAEDALSNILEQDGEAIEVSFDMTIGENTANNITKIENFATRFSGKNLFTTIDITITGGETVPITLAALESLRTKMIDVEIDADTMRTLLYGDFLQIANDASVMGFNAGDGFASGVGQGMDRAVEATSSGVSSIQATMAGAGSGAFGAGFSAGGAFGDGIAAGIGSRVSAIANAAASAVNAAEAAARSAADASSPSRLFATLGVDMDLGLAGGLLSAIPVVVRAARSVTDAAAGAVSGAIPNFGLGAMRAAEPFALAFAGPTPSTAMFNVNMDVTVPAANFPEWLNTVGFVQDLQKGFGVTLASKRGR